MGLGDIILGSIQTIPFTLIIVIIYFSIIWAITGRKLFKSLNKKVFWTTFLAAWGIIHVAFSLILPIVGTIFDPQEPKNIGIKMNVAIIVITAIVIHVVAPKDKLFAQAKSSGMKFKK